MSTPSEKPKISRIALFIIILLALMYGLTIIVLKREDDARLVMVYPIKIAKALYTSNKPITILKTF